MSEIQFIILHKCEQRTKPTRVKTQH